MSKTKQIMEYNNSNVKSVVGFNANSDGACFEFLFNKTLGNEKQCSLSQELDFLSELENPPSLFNLDNNLLSEKTNKNVESTITLDDLFNFVSDIPENEEPLFGSLSGEPQVPCAAEVLMDTALASPLSSSSEESYSLDELLFDDQSPDSLVEQISEERIQVIDSSSENQSQKETTEQTQLSNIIDSLASTMYDPSLGDQLQLNNDDFNALYILLQSQTSYDELKVADTSSITCDTSSIIGSPSSQSESESDEVRYTPYKKKKQKTPEQRQRKKQQNRNAALRYRVKKKDQFQTMNAEAQELEEKNRELKGKVEGLRTEIDYLKNLMLDVIKARLAKGTLPVNLFTSAMDS